MNQLATERSMDAKSESAGAEFARLGRIVAVTGGHAIILLDNGDGLPGSTPVKSPEIGTLLKVDTAPSIALALVSALSSPMPSNSDGDQELRIVEVEFIGELPKDETGTPKLFRRGISCYPSLGDVVSRATKDELAMAYACDAESSIRIGAIQQDSSIPAMVKIDELLGKHFAVLGTTGTGKSCSVALILRRILEKNPQAHILLLDLHREYAASFREYAELVQPDSMNLPFWLLNFDEIVEILIGIHPSRETDIEILRELIPIAKQRYMSNARRDIKGSGSIRQRDHQENGTIGVDTPVPYRASDLMGLLEEQLGRLDMKNDLAPYKRLKARLDTVSRDPRYQFMFGSLTVQDTMAQVLGRLFRIPVEGKPITILELGGLPSEVINVVVSVLARLAFDFGLWSGGRVPITFVCEEAHRYVPIDRAAGFEPTKRAISRIAKEGRKYGVSLCIVSQRPAELDPTILSQCNTIFSLRLTNERDQEILKAGISDTAASLLEFMPTMGTGEAISFGEGVALPTRIKFDMLPPSALPRSSTASFTGNWSRDVKDESFLADVVARWRNQALGAIDLAESPPAVQPSPPPSPQPPPSPRFGQAAGAAVPSQRPLPGQPIPAQSQSPSSIRNQAPSQPQSLAALLRQLKPN
jgi:DNA helicase HerA-like ATPase